MIYMLRDPRPDRLSCYVGQSKDPEARRRQHVRELSRSRSSGGSFHENLREDWLREDLGANPKKPETWPELLIFPEIGASADDSEQAWQLAAEAHPRCILKNRTVERAYSPVTGERHPRLLEQLERDLARLGHPSSAEVIDRMLDGAPRGAPAPGLVRIPVGTWKRNCEYFGPMQGTLYSQAASLLPEDAPDASFAEDYQSLVALLCPFSMVTECFPDLIRDWPQTADERPGHRAFLRDWFGHRDIGHVAIERTLQCARGDCSIDEAMEAVARGRAAPAAALDAIVRSFERDSMDWDCLEKADVARFDAVSGGLLSRAMATGPLSLSTLAKMGT